MIWIQIASRKVAEGVHFQLLHNPPPVVFDGANADL
jgi:hypothetical protein